MKVGQERQIEITGPEGMETVTYTSNDTDVVTVDSTGKVTGISDPSYNLYSLFNGTVYSKSKMDEMTNNIEEDAESELILREFDKLDCDELDDNETSKIWTEIQNVIEDSDELNKIVNERLSELYSRLGKEKFVKVYDCGRIALEFQSK